MTSTVPGTIEKRYLDAGLRRLTVGEYHRMIQIGLLTEDDDVELLEGLMVFRFRRGPLHCSTLSRLMYFFFESISVATTVRNQLGMTLLDSEPEPDLAIVREAGDDYCGHHPYAADTYLVIEVADLSLELDQRCKQRIYSRAGIPIYWIVNLVDHRIEVYTEPSGPTEEPSYAKRTDYALGMSVPVIFDGVEVAQLPVAVVLG